MRPRIAVVHHSRRGSMRTLARAAAEGVRAAGGEVRLLRVADEEAAGVEWPERVAGPNDVLWANGLVLATPTYFGNVSAPFKRFLDSTSPLWRRRLLSDRVVTGMTSSTCTHGGREATLLSLHQTAYHWGSWVVGADPFAPAFGRSGGNPYGLSVDSRPDGPDGAERDAARLLGHRLTGLTARVHRGHAAAAEARPVRVTVVHCADEEPARLLAQECAAGARSVGARVRLRRVASERRPARAAAVATAEDVAWADAVVFGAPARLGGMAASLLRFVQSLDSGDRPGPLSGKPASGFVTAARAHSGGESALLAFHHALLHSGAVVVPPGFTDPVVFEAGGNPYGTSHPMTAGALPTREALAAVAYQGRRTALAGDLLRRPAAGPARRAAVDDHRAVVDDRLDESLGGLRDESAAVRRDRRVLRGIQDPAHGALPGAGQLPADAR
ncbi:flavodoxin family protein [Streptomyces sp. NPDC020141]|uniref:flavodoxin family protein n=1 Tax=Streptomyces sp. NPDC020141 TaxID=3365065 RepID=UPI0037A8BE2E